MNLILISELKTLEMLTTIFFLVKLIALMWKIWCETVSVLLRGIDSKQNFNMKTLFVCESA